VRNFFSGGEQRQLYFCQHHSAGRKNVRKSKKKKEEKIAGEKGKADSLKNKSVKPPVYYQLWR
jgi:hypothetical protein